MTGEQRKFAEENHGLIYAFLHKSGCSIDDCYGPAALGFLQAVQRYLTQPRLRRYAFATIAWQAMGSEIALDYRAELRQKNAERRYLETMLVRTPDFDRELETQMLLRDITAGASEEQRRLVLLRLQGCTVTEAARVLNMNVRRARKLLNELQKAYHSE